MDPYKILGVTKTATQDEIKNAYRALAKKYHPDLNPGNKDMEAKFKEVSAAYELIGHPEQRGKFDRGETPEQMEAAARDYANRARQNYYDTQQEQGARYSSHFGGANAEDIFESLFRSANAGGGNQRRQRASDFPGEDMLFQMEVDLRDAARGAEREISLPNGKNLRVKIPAGMESGSKLRFRGQGGPGIGKGAAGNVYVEVRVRPMHGYHRKGNDLETELPISFIEALTGAELPVPTLDGTVMLKIPPGVTTGSKLRIRGKGVASAKNPGDQIVNLKVAMPKKVDPALAEAVRAWNGKHSYDPRGGA